MANPKPESAAQVAARKKEQELTWLKRRAQKLGVTLKRAESGLKSHAAVKAQLDETNKKIADLEKPATTRK